MTAPRFARSLALAALLAPAAALPFAHMALAQSGTPPTARNVVIFVADGLRYDSVTPQTAPTLYALKQKGVDFTNSHAVYPTLTTANASAIATGHELGDTGDYANSLYTGFPVKCTINAASEVVFVEDDCVLTKLKAQFPDGYMAQTTLLQAARQAGYNTVIIGKKGPSAIQWLGALKSANDTVDTELGVMIDDSTNHPKNIDGTPTYASSLHADLANEAFGATGSGAPPFTSAPNLTQQAWLASMTSQSLIPDLHDSGKPFVLLFWSRDPDATQHGATDSQGSVTPGINSIDAHQAIYNADTNLKTILDALKLWGMDGNTDVFVTADHGFSTIGMGIPEPDGTLPRSTLGRGFVALDVAGWLGGEKLFDPENSNLQVHTDNGERPSSGSAFIGPSASHPRAIVVANGGSDFLYIPDGADKLATARTIYAKLAQQPYVGGLFVSAALMKEGGKAFAGALTLRDIGLTGSSNVPRPDIVISFRSFVAKGCKLSALLCTVEVADTSLLTGQGMHGSFSRADTRNFMAAMGPDFKAGFKDTAPVGNVDIAPTLASLLKITLSGPGHVYGRVATEALKGGRPVAVKKGRLTAEAGPGGVRTIGVYQEAGQTRYFDAAGIPGRTVGVPRK